MAGGLAVAGLAAVSSPIGALAADSAGQRKFKLIRGGDDDVGYHTISARQTAQGLAIDIDILIEIRVLGFRAYVYEHSNRELWRDGVLTRLESTTNDDGEKQTVSAARSGDMLKINGTSFNGQIPAAQAAPTSWWNYNTIGRDRWFSSQTGKLLNLRFRNRQEGPLERVDVSGDFMTTLIYDAGQEWRGCVFDAGGEPIVYRQSAPGPKFQALA